MCAQIIDARVKQKTGTAADFAGYTLLEGEIALVRTSANGPVWNFKVGPGNFDSLDWSLQNPGAAQKADTSTVFPAGVPGLYIPIESGTIGGVPVDLSSGYTQLIWDGASLVDVVFPIDLSGYVAKGDISTKPGGNNLFNPNDYLQGYAMNNDGSLATGPGYETGQVTGKIYWKDGETHVTISGFTGSGSGKRIIFFNDDDEKVGNTGDLTTSPYTRARQGSGSYFRVYFHSRLDPGDDSSTVMINWGQTPLPYEPPYEIVDKIDGIKVEPDPGSFYNKQQINSLFVANNDLTITERYINQLFRKDDYLQDATLSTNGNINQGPAYAGGQVTGKIPVKEGETHITISGYTGSSTKYAVSYNDNDEKVGVTGSFQDQPFYSYPIQPGSTYVRFYFHSRNDPGDDVDTVMINYGQTALPHEDGVEVVSKIKGYPLDAYQQDLSQLVTKTELQAGYYNKSEIDAMDFGVPEYVDDRYENQFANMQAFEAIKRLESTVLSLRQVKSTDSGVVSALLPGTGQDINEPVVVPVNVHWGNSVGDSKGGEIFMNENCRQDFTDIRFLDSSGNLLDAYKVSHGNYEFIYDANIKGQMLELPNGDMIGSGFNTGEGVFISSDNMETWTQLRSSGVVVGLNANNDLFVADDGTMYKRTAASSYATETAVLAIGSGQSFRYQSFAMDDQNNLYYGSYQDDFNVELYKSTDGGDTWSVIFTDPAQHIHSIILDKTVTPWRIFLNIDGVQWLEDGREPKTMYSNDRGATWQQMTFFDGIEPDYGVLYARGNVLIGSGEGDIKGYPSIYKSTDFGATWRVVMNASINLPIITPFKGALYAMNFARGANVFPSIYRSDDEGDTWTTIQNIGQIPRTYNQVGWRYGAIKPITPTGDVEQLALAGSDIPSLRIKAESNNHQSLWYVKVPTLPSAGLNIQVGYGYLAQEVEADIFNSEAPTTGLIAHLPLNEFSSKVRETVKGKVFNVTADWDGGITKRYGKTVPEKHPAVMAGALVKSGLVLSGSEYGLTFRKNFTVNFWYKMKMEHIPGNTEAPKFLFGTANTNFNFSRRYRTQFRLINQNTTNSISNMFRVVGWTEYQMYTVVVTNDALPTIKFYVNGRQVGSTTASSYQDPGTPLDWVIGGGTAPTTGGYIPDDGHMTDWRLWNRQLTDVEIMKMFDGCRLISVK